MKASLTEEITGWNRLAYQKFLSQWDWEWFLTARLTSCRAFKEPSTIMKEFYTKLLRQEGGQIGSMGIFVHGESGPHIHALLLGRFPEGRTLRDINEKFLEEKMEKITGRSCIISQVDDENNRVHYIVKGKNTPAGRHELLTPWGRILSKTKNQ